MLRNDSPMATGGGTMMNRKRVCVSLIVLGALLAGMPKARAQGDQEPSVADAARRAREQKQAAAKPSAVITNETLKPASPATPEGGPQAAGDATANAATNANAAGADAATAATSAKPAAASGPTAAEAAEKKARITALRQQVADKKKEVDLQQRDLTLANDDFYSRPDFSKDADGKARLDAMQSDLKQKQDELAGLQAKLAAEGPDATEKPETAEKPAARITAGQELAASRSWDCRQPPPWNWSWWRVFRWLRFPSIQEVAG